MQAEHAEAVVLTGVGLALPTGRGIDALWSALALRQPALAAYRDELIETTLIPWYGRVPETVRAAARDRVPHKLRRFAPDYSSCAVLAADDALAEAGLDAEAIPEERRGIYVAQSDSPFPNVASFARAIEAAGRSGAVSLPELAGEALHRRGVDPFAVVKALSNNVLALVSMAHRLRGYCGAFVQGQGAALSALERARFALIHGYCDLALVVGAASYNDALMFAEQLQLGHLSPCPQGCDSLRSFDRERDGTVLGEGAVALVLERRRDAWHRGAQPLLEISRVMAAGSDPRAPRRLSELAGRVRAMLAEADVKPEMLGAVLAEGKGTLAHDAEEIELIEHLLIEHAVPVTSARPVVGELNAAGPLADIATVAAVFRHASVPPIATLRTPASSQIDLVRQTCRPLAGESVLTLHAGFSGFSGATLLKAPRSSNLRTSPQ